MRFLRLSLAVVVASLVTVSAASAQNDKGIARLEAARAARPNDAAVARSLGIAYYKQNKFAEARPHLEHAVRLDPRDGAGSLYLGLTAEQMQDLPAAKAAYSTYIRFGRTSRVRKQLEARLAAITRQELEAAAKSAVAAEQQLVAQPGSPTTIAVLPLRFTGSDTSLQPLERGLAELITIDLSRSSKLTVVERARLQALLDEIKLQQSGATDSTTNVRASKIIQAGHVVNGQILQDGQRLRVDAAIVNTTTSQVAGGAAFEDALEQLFAIEKAIVLKLFQDLGITLTTAERNLIEERPTRSIQAFLAFSKGLQLEDEGKYDEAARSFGDAARMDPTFGAASQKSRESSQAAIGMTMSVASVEQQTTTGTPEGNVARQAEQGTAGQSSGTPSDNSPRNQADNINQSSAGGATAGAGAGSSSNAGNTNTANRDALSSATGSETGRSTTRLTVVVRIPR